MQLPNPQEINRVAVIGAGTIGASWAAQFLACGMSVRVSDPAPDSETRVRRFIDRVWSDLETLGLHPDADPRRISFHTDPAEAARGVQFIQESGPENLETKIELLQRLDLVMQSGTVLASSSSGLLISKLQAGRVGKERYIIGHPFNPPHLIPLVEVVGGRDTDPAAVQWAIDFYTHCGKRAIRIAKEVPGHLANRLQAAMWREAVHAVASGIADVADVDAAIAYGPGLRWALMGPHLTFHLAGGEGGMRHFLEHLGPANEDWWQDLGTPKLTPEVGRRLIEGVEQEAAGMSIPDLVRRRDTLLLVLLETLATTRRRLDEAE